jgi:hypothetical protein
VAKPLSKLLGNSMLLQPVSEILSTAPITIREAASLGIFICSPNCLSVRAIVKDYAAEL